MQESKGNITAFLDTIAVSEGTKGIGDDGYNLIVGGELFTDYSDHPRKKVWVKRINKYSTAAGRYQILERFFDAYKKQLNLPDFGPESQDKIAYQMIKECHATTDIVLGLFDLAIDKCRTRWASFPGAGYGQHENKLDKLRQAFIKAGGTLA